MSVADDIITNNLVRLGTFGTRTYVTEENARLAVTAARAEREGRSGRDQDHREAPDRD